MKKKLTILLQVITVLIGLGTAAFMLWEPHVEGRNVNSTIFEIYFNDPFLAYAYLGSTPFFMILYQVYKILGLVGQNKLNPTNFVKSLRIIKYCAITLIGLIGAAEIYLFLAVRGKDDIAGGVAMGSFLIMISVIIAITAARFERSQLKGGS